MLKQDAATSGVSPPSRQSSGSAAARFGTADPREIFETEHRAGEFPTFADFGYDGRRSLRHVVASTFGGLEQAIASLTLFSHPDTVAQTGGKAVFKIIRDAGRRGSDGVLDGSPVTYDDNAAPTHVFLWCNAIQRPKEVQFNHVYSDSSNPGLYTALPNICVTPAFLAKATDTDPTIRAILAHRVYDLYGWVPEGKAAPPQPAGYQDLVWAPTLAAVQDVRTALLARLQRGSRSRTALSAGRIGWLFG